MNMVQCYICKEYFDKDDEKLKENYNKEITYNSGKNKIPKIATFEIENGSIYDLCYKCGNMLAISYAMHTEKS